MHPWQSVVQKIFPYPNDNIEMGRGGRSNAFASVLCAFVPTILATEIVVYVVFGTAILNIVTWNFETESSYNSGSSTSDKFALLMTKILCAHFC